VQLFVAAAAALSLGFPACSGSRPADVPASSGEATGGEAAEAQPSGAPTSIEDAGSAPASPPDAPDGGTADDMDRLVQLERRASAPDTAAFYGRLLGDLRAGKPLVATVYVALCDNDSQGIVPVRNRSICDGDVPMQNMYWVGDNALAGLAKKRKWKSVSRVEDPDGALLIEQIWTTSVRPEQRLREAGVAEPFRVVVVGRAYRGNRIHEAFVDYLRAIHGDDAVTARVDGIDVAYGGAGHVVGYVGHDYMMDVAPGSTRLREVIDATAGGSTLAKGVFALACAGDSWIRPFVSRDNAYIMALNVYLGFPNAWAFGGILDGIAAQGDGDEIHRAAAKGFAAGQECGLGWALKALGHGPRPTE
jgi:hypothetical protein